MARFTDFPSMAPLQGLRSAQRLGFDLVVQSSSSGKSLVKAATSRAIWLASGLSSVYLALCAVGRLGYRGLLYPAPQIDDATPPQRAQIVELRAADGARVHAMRLANRSAKRPGVYFHGNGEVRGDTTRNANPL